MSVPNTPSLLYNYVQQKPNKVINRISPSQVGRCMRAHFYAIKHIQQTTPPNPGALLNFEVGFLWEDVLRQAMEAAGIPYMYQLKLRHSNFDLEGTLDFALFDREADCWDIMDSKTEGTKAKMWRKRQKHTFFEHHPEYVHQLNSYYLLMTDHGFKVGKGGFTIIDKDNGYVTEETLPFTSESIEQTVERILTLEDYLKANKVPPCECEGWQVGYCNYGRPGTRAQNTTKKWVNTQCCGSITQIAKWRKEEFADD